MAPTSGFNLTCDVCGQPALGVASSCVGAISWAFCRECINQQAEPEFSFFYLYDDVSHDGEGLAEWVECLRTFKDGRYWTWKEWVQWRHDIGRGKSEPTPYPEPNESEYDSSYDDGDPFEVCDADGDN
jgi:hypothetical protein